MSDKEFRVRVQDSVQEYVQHFMAQNNVSASMMEDAMNKAMVWVKEQVTKELILSMAIQNQTNAEEEKEEEDGAE